MFRYVYYFSFGRHPDGIKTVSMSVKYIWSYSFSCGYDSTFKIADISNSITMYNVLNNTIRKRSLKHYRSVEIKELGLLVQSMSSETSHSRLYVQIEIDKEMVIYSTKNLHTSATFQHKIYRLSKN